MVGRPLEPAVTARTIGVEEEFLVVGARTGEPVAIGPALVAEASDAGIKGEFKQEQVETCSLPADSLDVLSLDLERLRRDVARLAGAHDAAVVASGTWPGVHVPTPSVSDRFARIGEEFGELAHQQLTCGTHVHVSVSSPDEGVLVLDRIRPWLALLTALTANSPHWQGRDTGHASWRSLVLSQLPTAGPAPVWGDHASYRRAARAIIDAGGAFDEGMLYYDARLSARYPTVEIRVTDTCPDLGTTVAVAGLCRALVATVAHAATGPAATSSPRGDHSTPALRAASWRAARHGLGERLVDPASGDLVPAADALSSLLEFTGGALDHHGDLERVRDVVERLLVDGTSAERQRRLVDPRSPWPGLAGFRVG
ncbi:glutamate--cysteine ligase [Knoellia locipacati]|uniref:carboxylate-amine ligase n=1 Tax=Knoellia locipacati TaxID=882824 RepID=UPI00384E9292